jgi:hypothetical protein
MKQLPTEDHENPPHPFLLPPGRRGFIYPRPVFGERDRVRVIELKIRKS